MQRTVNREWRLPLRRSGRRSYSSVEKSGGSEQRFYRELIRKAIIASILISPD